MKSFFRAVRLVLSRPFLLIASLLCSFLVAALWGGNITALYPIVEVTFQGRSLQQWAADEIKQSSEKVRDLKAEIDQLRQIQKQQGKRAQLEESPEATRRRAAQLDSLGARLQAEQRALGLAKRWQPLVERYLPHDPFQTVVVFVLLLLAATALKNVLSVANVTLTTKVVQRVIDDLRQKLFDHVLAMDVHSFEKRGANRVATMCHHGVRAIGVGLQSLFGGAVREPLKMIACLTGAAFICWRLLVMAMLLAPVAILLTVVLARRIRATCSQSLDDDVGVNFAALEAFNGLQTVQAYTMETPERQRFDRGVRNASRRRVRIAFLKALAKPFTELVGIAAVGVAVVAGAYLVLNQETHLLGIQVCDRPLSLPALLVFYGLLMGMHDPARKMSDVFASIQLGCAAADRVYTLLDTPSKVQSPERPLPLPASHRCLTLENVSFAYRANQRVVCDVNLTIDHGETLAIVGSNGCGKSTMVGLLPRFYDPSYGRVLWDRVDLREAEVAEIRRRIAYVTQKTVLFDDSVLNNIRYGSPDAPMQEVVAAAQQAKLHDVIEGDLDNGYETHVGQNGCCLSSGQRQRIALARAILRDPQILILDEATSQVDLQSELLIQQALEQFLHDRTTIIVTHRPSMLHLANRIVVMDAGRITEIGTHKQLLARCSFYRRLQNHDLQKTA